MTGRTPCRCKVPPVWVLNQCGRSTKTGELQQRSRRNRRRPFDRSAAQRRHVGRTRTLGRQRRRQQRHSTTHRLFIVGMRARIEIDFRGVTVAAARGLQRLCRSVVEHAAAACAMIGAPVAPMARRARMLFCDALARERDIRTAARRQQIDSKQQQRYVSSPGHTFRTIRTQNGQIDCKITKITPFRQFFDSQFYAANPSLRTLRHLLLSEVPDSRPIVLLFPRIYLFLQYISTDTESVSLFL